MARSRRPANATFIAICNIFLGLPCVCCVGMGLAGNVIGFAGAQPAPGGGPNQAANANNPFGQMMAQQEEEEKFMEKELPQKNKIDIVVGAVNVLTGVLLLVSGVGLFMTRPWGRLLCLIAVGLMLLSTLAETAYNLTVVYPVAEKFDRQQAAQGKQEEFGAAQSIIVGVVVAGVIGIGYPVLAFAVMMTPACRAAYSGAGGEDEHDRYHTDDDYNRPRRYEEDLPPHHDDYDR